MNLDLELETRLINWSYWVINLPNQGYPNKSIGADFAFADSHVSRSKPPFPINNLQADEVNGWINILGISHPEYKDTIYDYYLRINGERIYELSKKRKISPGRFKQRLQCARLWLTGRLSIGYQK